MTEFHGGRYEPLGLLGEGSSARVEEVRDRVVGGPRLALKRLPAARAQLALDEFRRLRALRHPGVLHVVELGLDARSGDLFFTSELGRGVPFLLALREAPLERQLLAIADLLRTLAMLDERGVVHRDLKPANLLVDGGADPRVLVVDFGLACASGPNEVVAGSLPYLAPELFVGGVASHASDLYALGVVLFELWNGRLPFAADTPTEWARAHRDAPVVFADAAACPGALREVVARLLQKEPSRRYPHAHEVLADLSRASATRLPRSSRRSLLGRIRSLPRLDPPWRERVEPGDLPPAATVTWIHAPTRAGRDELSRDLRAAAVVGEAAPIVVSFAPAADALSPREALLSQLRALHADGAASRDDAALLESLRAGPPPRRAVLFLEEVDRRRPDDEALLRFLLRAKVEVVASSGQELRDDPLALDALPRGAEVRTLVPRPLAADEVARAFPKWIGAPLPESLARWLGLAQEVDAPRLIESLCHLAETGALELDEAGLRFDASRVDVASAPSDVLALLERRLARLDERGRAALEALAVLDADATAAQVASLAPSCDATVLAALADAGLVDRVGDRLRPASGALVALVLPSIPAARARELHARAARVVAEERGAVDRELRLSRHRFRASVESESALDYVRQAHALVSGGRSAEADAIARELIDDARDDEARRVAQLVRGMVEFRRGSHAVAERTLRPLGDELVDPALRGIALVEHARALDRCGKAGEALARLDAAGGAAPPTAIALRAYLLHQLQRDAEAEAVASEALARGATTPDFAPHRLHVIRALALWRLDRPDDARAAFESALAAAEPAGSPLVRASIENNLARFEEDCGRLQAALDRFRRALAATASFGDRQQEAMVAQNLAGTLYDVGWFADAKRELARAREIGLAMQQTPVLRRVALQQAQVAMNEGDLEAAGAALDEACRLADAVGDRRGRWLAELVRTELSMRRGAIGAAREELARLESDPLARDSAELRHYAAEYRLQLVSFCGSRQSVEAALAALPAPPRSVKRRVQIGDARLRALLKLRRDAELADVVARQRADLAATDFVALRAHAEAARCVAELRATGAVSPAAAAAARGALDAVRSPGHAARRAEAALVLGVAVSDVRLLEEAESLARRVGHRPLLRRASFARRRLAARLGVGAADSEQLRSLTRLTSVAKRIGATTDGEELLRFVLDHAIEATGARRGFLVLARGNDVAIRAARAFDASDVENPEMSLSSSVARRVASDGCAVLLSDVSADERFRHAASISHLKLLSVLCVPMRVRDRVVGSIYVDDPTRIDAFAESDRRYVEELSDFAAIALEKAELLAEIRSRTTELEHKQQEIERLNRELQSALLRNQDELESVKASLEKTKRQVARALDFEGIVAQSGAMEEVKRKIELFADSDLPVFVVGESGTGKELAARALHRKSARKSKPYESLNCATMQPTLVENELFGHLRGAFTGANDDRAGLFERVDGGTLFLDEVCDASAELQAKLLRVAQFGEVQRLGGGPVRKVDVRIVAASNRDLVLEVKAGRFREDLMYRLDVLHLDLPPLRERREDVPLLIEHFQRLHGAKAKAKPLQFSPRAWKRLLRHDWPGNVRELENAVQRLLLLHRDGEEIGPEEVFDERTAAPVDSESVAPLSVFLDQREREHVLEALARTGGNRARAAKLLGISARALYVKLAKHGISGANGSHA